MGYSFTIKAPTKAAALAAVAEKVNEIVASQPVHERDRPAILANAQALVGLLHDEQDQDVCVACTGYLSWKDPAQPTAAEVTTAVITCSASYVNRE